MYIYAHTGTGSWKRVKSTCKQPSVQIHVGYHLFSAGNFLACCVSASVP